MYIGFTGTRSGMTPEQKAMLRCIFEECFTAANPKGIKLEFVHGGAIGADHEAHNIARVRYFDIVHVYPCRNLNLFGKFWNSPPVKALHILHEVNEPLVRNRIIVDLSNGMIAAPLGFTQELRSGTWATIRYARKKKTPLKIIWPDGSVLKENCKPDVPPLEFKPTSSITGKT